MKFIGQLIDVGVKTKAKMQVLEVKVLAPLTPATLGIVERLAATVMKEVEVTILSVNQDLFDNIDTVAQQEKKRKAAQAELDLNAGESAGESEAMYEIDWAKDDPDGEGISGTMAVSFTDVNTAMETARQLRQENPNTRYDVRKVVTEAEAETEEVPASEEDEAKSCENCQTFENECKLSDEDLERGYCDNWGADPTPVRKPDDEELPRDIEAEQSETELELAAEDPELPEEEDSFGESK